MSDLRDINVREAFHEKQLYIIRCRLAFSPGTCGVRHGDDLNVITLAGERKRDGHLLETVGRYVN